MYSCKKFSATITVLGNGVLLSAVEFLPSEWLGNYTCDNDNLRVFFRMNITKAADTINLIGNMNLNGTDIVTEGSFATYNKWLTLQGDQVVMAEVLGRNLTKVELNGILRTPVFINGVILFRVENGSNSCPMELRRGPCKLK